MKETYIKELELDPKFVRKRRVMLVAYMVRMFMIGVEYSIILPSAWLYLKTFNVDTWFMGIVIASYPFAAMIVLPIVGRLYDRTLRNTEIVLLLNAFLVAGNIMYAIPFSKWYPLAGRFIAGIGDSFIACAVGEASRIYPAKSRTGIFSLLELGRVMGLILGPALNFFIADTDFKLWRWRINYATMPGVIMALGWILMELITWFCTYNLAAEVVAYEKQRESLIPEEENKSSPSGKESDVLGSDFLDDNENGWSESEDDHKKLIDCSSQEDVLEEASEFENEEEIGTKLSAKDTLLQLVAIEFLVLFYVDVVLWLSQTEFEILLPLVTENDYGWQQQHVGLVYAIGGLELVVIFSIIYVIGTSCAVRDSYMLISSLIFTLSAMALMIYESYLTVILHREYVFGAICILVFASIPLNLVASKSLLSKVTIAEGQGLIQGFYSGITRVALICGPMLGSIAYHNRKVYGVIMSTLCFVGLLAFTVCLRKLHQREADMKIKQVVED